MIQMDAPLVLIPGLAGNDVMWRAQLAGLADFRPVVTDVIARQASIPAMAAALLQDHPGPLVLCGASMATMPPARHPNASPGWRCWEPMPAPRPRKCA